jgi:predicted small secreted protein
MSKLKSLLVAIVAALTISCCMAGCNTVECMGEDIQEAGRAIEDAAD